MEENNTPQIIGRESVFIADTVTFGKNVIIYPNNILEGNTTIGDNTILKPNNYIKDTIIDNDCTIDHSHIQESHISNNCTIGPFSRLRPNSIIGSHCKIGNFVEIKNSTLGDYCKASHLAYIGDVVIGKSCNIGCGAIFVNYNGKAKFKSIIGDNCFIGSNANIIAPVTIAHDSYICAGTTITKDTRPFDFVIGRSHETIKHNYAQKYK